MLAAAPTFCKCTCFKNSTIVPLDEANNTDNHSSLLRRETPLDILSNNPSVAPHSEKRKNRKLSPRVSNAACSQCTKAFCLAQDLDICKDATEADVQTTCFQRDSNKDKIIVWGFILGTSGLLGWAAFKKIMARREGGGLGRLGGGGYSFLGRGSN